jgi:hypothetical protein
MLNICNSSATLNVDVASPSAVLDVTTYSATDPGGWAPLPTNASDLPWAAPLKPITAHAAVGAPHATLSIAPLSFSLHVITVV